MEIEINFNDGNWNKLQWWFNATEFVMDLDYLNK